MVRVPGISRRFRLALAAIFLAAVVPGCASFKEIKTFASLSSNAAGYDALTRDYIGALDRRRQYQPQEFHGGLEAQKMRREAQRASLDLLQQTVTDYMEGLGGLATGEIRTYDKPLKELGTSLNKATLLANDEKEAVSALSAILARAVTAAYRQHEIKKLVRDANQPLQDVIKATRKIVSKGIIPDLSVESALVERYYDNLMLAPGNPEEPLAMALAQEVKVEALGRVSGRAAGAEAYDEVLERISMGHQHLHDNRKLIGTDEFDRQFKPYIEELRGAYRNLLDVLR